MPVSAPGETDTENARRLNGPRVGLLRLTPGFALLDMPDFGLLLLTYHDTATCLWVAPVFASLAPGVEPATAIAPRASAL